MNALVEISPMWAEIERRVQACFFASMARRYRWLEPVERRGFAETDIITSIEQLRTSRLPSRLHWQPESGEYHYFLVISCADCYSSCYRSKYRLPDLHGQYQSHPPKSYRLGKFIYSYTSHIFVTHSFARWSTMARNGAVSSPSSSWTRS